MEESGDNKQKEIDLMEKFNDPCDYKEKNLFEITKQEVERTIDATMKSLLEPKCNLLNGNFPYACFFKKNNDNYIDFQQIRIVLYKLYQITLSEEEYTENDINNIAKNIIKKLNDLLTSKKTFEEKLTTFISFDYILNITLINHIAQLLKEYFDIKKDSDNNFWHCIPKYNLEIIKWAEQEPSLQSVMKYYYKHDIKKALGELRKITEFNNQKNEKFKNFVLKQPKELQEMCKKVYDFITKCESHNDGFENAIINEQRIWLDLGLSIYRLYIISDNANKNPSNEKEAVNDIGDEDIPF